MPPVARYGGATIAAMHASARRMAAALLMRGRCRRLWLAAALAAGGTAATRRDPAARVERLEEVLLQLLPLLAGTCGYCGDGRLGLVLWCSRCRRTWSWPWEVTAEEFESIQAVLEGKRALVWPEPGEKPREQGWATTSGRGGRSSGVAEYPRRGATRSVKMNSLCSPLRNSPLLPRPS